ncbi:uncharacterized protein LOC134436916 [Engraulis encrasicolus]|uniref:uncharacterized protein LOC134436916 n=1 Tax=Engraulis encrasicolus TaxID=184585 RepID=UPI002FD6FCAB
MEDDGQEERQPSGCCFMGALRSLVATVRDSIRRRRVRQRQKNYRIAKMHVEEEEAGAEKPKGTKRKKWLINRFRRRPKDRQAAAAGKTAPKSSPEKAIKAPQATEAIEEKEEVVPEAPAGAAGLQDDEASPTATDHAADDADHAADDADHADHAAADDEGDVQLKGKIVHIPGKGAGPRLTAVSKCADLSPRNYDDDGDAKSAEEARRCCEDVVQATLLDQRADCCNTMPPSCYDYLMGYDTPEGLTTLRHIMETDESEAWDLFVLLSLTVTLGIITFYFFVSLFKIITEDV